MTSINTPQAALVKIQVRKTKDLIRDFILTGTMMDAAHAAHKPYDPNLPTVRGWLMDEIERRYPEAFEKWMDSDLDDDGLYQFIKC
jgi:hypothetical protein